VVILSSFEGPVDALAPFGSILCYIWWEHGSYRVEGGKNEITFQLESQVLAFYRIKRRNNLWERSNIRMCFPSSNSARSQVAPAAPIMASFVSIWSK